VIPCSYVTTQLRVNQGCQCYSLRLTVRYSSVDVNGYECRLQIYLELVKTQLKYVVSIAYVLAIS
jgi:hypothetical protein